MVKTLFTRPKFGRHFKCRYLSNVPIPVKVFVLSIKQCFLRMQTLDNSHLITQLSVFVHEFSSQFARGCGARGVFREGIGVKSGPLLTFDD